MENKKESLFETRLHAVLRAHPCAELPSGFAARMRAMAETTAVPRLLQEMPFHAEVATLPAASMVSRAHMFAATALFIVSFAGGSLYANYTDVMHPQSVQSSETIAQIGDPILNSLYYAYQEVL